MFFLDILDISKRTSSTPNCFASCFAVSVLPTPVGTHKHKRTNDLLSGLSPACATRILSTIPSIAVSCPYARFLISF